MRLKLKKSVAVSLAGIAALGLGSSALAQSSVTVYGILDTGVEHVTNVGPTGASVTRMPGITGSVPSRLGFRGTEDLGGGLRANFVLEQGLSVDSGTFNQGGRPFGRQAYVGLSGSWGALSFGRQYSQLFWSLIGDTMGPNIYSMGDLDGYLANDRIDNNIAYRGTFGGFTVGATYSFGRDVVLPAAAGGCAGESAVDSKACRATSFAVQYATPVWGVALASERLWGGAGAGSPLPLSSQTDTRSVINGFYKVAGMTLGGGYMRRDWQGNATPRRNLMWVGVTYPMGPWVFDVQYGKLDVKNSGDDSQLIAARAQYLFSKRTAVYATAGRVFNKGAAAITIDGGVVAGSAPPPGGDQTGIMLGVRHSF